MGFSGLGYSHPGSWILRFPGLGFSVLSSWILDPGSWTGRGRGVVWKRLLRSRQRAGAS